MAIEIRSHGGGCCGIRVIKGLRTDPESIVNAKPKETWKQDDRWSNDLHGGNKENLFFPERPKEMAIRRFDAAVDYITEWRPRGVIEVALRYGFPDESKPDWKSQKRWVPLLRRRGFRRVSKFVNSNTGALIHVYHKIT